MNIALQKYLHEQAPQKKHGKELIDEWLRAIDELFTDIKKWLKESDPDGVIDIELSHQKVNEPQFGSYTAPRMNLYVLGKWIGIIPKARQNPGSAKPPRKSVPERAEGRIDITDELRRYVLYRFREGDQYKWYIEGQFVEREWPGQVVYQPRIAPLKELDAESFSEALLSYLL